MRIQEQSGGFKSGGKIDRDAGVIFDVKLLGDTSVNGYVYPFETRQAAIRVMEGAKSNLNHQLMDEPKGKLPIERRFGVVRNLRNEVDGIYGDLHYLKSHPNAGQIVEMAERFPEALGMSIDAYASGKTKDAAGRTIIAKIERIKSVDVVANAGTTHSLFESDNTDPEPEEATVTEAEKAELETLRTEKSCRHLLEAAGMTPSDDVMAILADLPNEDARKRFLAHSKKLSVVKEIKAGGTAQPIQEAAQDKPQAKPDDFVAAALKHFSTVA